VILRVGLDVLESRKNILPLPGIKPRFLGRPTRRLVNMPTDTYITKNKGVESRSKRNFILYVKQLNVSAISGRT
jgi:hypothetical protein